MKVYNFDEKVEKILNMEIVRMISEIRELKGKQTVVYEQNKEELLSLMKIAKIQSVEKSNKIEGIYTSAKRIDELILEKTTPVNRDEEEIIGYRDVLNTIHENYKYIDIKSNTILQLHRDLYSYNPVPGGEFKNSNNIIEATLEDGSKKTRFTLVKSAFTKDAIESLCIEYQKAINKNIVDQLILIMIFILDFLCIHPFNDGNGRMSRLLTLLLLYKEKYYIGKYISIEKIIEETKELYYNSLEISSKLWHENENDYIPFVNYMLSVILKAYREFEERRCLFSSKKMKKPEQIEYIIKNSLKQLSKNEISNKCPHISIPTIDVTITKLLKEDKIIKIGDERSSKYIWKNK